MKRRRATPENTRAATPVEATPGMVGRLRSLPRGVVLLSGSLAVLTLLYGGALYVLRPASPGHALTLDAVVRAAVDGRITEARLLDEDARIVGTERLTTGGRRHFWASYPHSDAATNDLLRSLLSGPARVTVDSQSGKALVRFVTQFLFPLVILANLFALLFYLVRGGGSGTEGFTSFGQIGDRRVRQKERTTFADVAGADDSVAELADVCQYLANPEAFRRIGAAPPKGVLIIGPPGCGKTLLARAVAGEAKANFFSISGSEFVESLVGVGAARVRDLFRQARAMSPAIIFIDELDAVGRQRGAGLGGGHDEREQTLNELLVQIDGFTPADGVAVLAASNRVDILDPALLRRGRFDRHVVVDRPDLAGRLAILRLHARSKRLADPHADLPAIARRTPGFTGADLATLLNEAGLLAVRERADAINYVQLEEAVERLVSGSRRKRAIIGPEDKRRIAYHEAGHAVVAAALGKATSIDKLSVITRGRGIGHLALLSDERLLSTRDDMEVQVAIAMGGVAAEELALGQPSTGAEADLERATNIARDMAGRFGMSGLGRVRLLREQREVFLGRDYLLSGDVSQPTLEHLDSEVRRILDQQERLARSILEAERPILDMIAAGLTTYETVSGAPLAQVLAAVWNRRGTLPSPQPAVPTMESQAWSEVNRG